MSDHDVNMSPEEMYDAIVRFGRHDTEDDSTLFCACGHNFTCGGFPPTAFDEWLAAHVEHNPDRHK